MSLERVHYYVVGGYYVLVTGCTALDDGEYLKPKALRWRWMYRGETIYAGPRRGRECLDYLKAGLKAKGYAIPDDFGRFVADEPYNIKLRANTIAIVLRGFKELPIRRIGFSHTGTAASFNKAMKDARKALTLIEAERKLITHYELLVRAMRSGKSGEVNELMVELAEIYHERATLFETENAPEGSKA